MAAAIAAAIGFGLGRGEQPGQVAVEVVALHDRVAEGPPSPGTAITGGFARRAAAAGWIPSGGRTDAVEGHAVVTTFWERSGRRIAHSSIGGARVDAPDAARRTGRRGVLLRSFDADGRVAVLWPGRGRTELISAAGVSRAALYDLAGGRPLR